MTAIRKEPVKIVQPGLADIEALKLTIMHMILPQTPC